MTITYGLFNSIGGDRVYKAENFADYFASFIGNGVFPNPSTGLKVVASTGLNIVVKPGKGWIFGYYVVNDADHTIKLDNPDGTLKRIDRIVLRLDYIQRTLTVAVKKGTNASSPVAKTLQRDSDAYELALADVLINNGSLTITDANITDLRLDNSLCGIVHGVVDQVDTSDIHRQYASWFNQFKTTNTSNMTTWQEAEKADFTSWIATIQDILDADTAGNLLTMINAINNDTIRNPIHGRTTNTGNQYTINDSRNITAYVDDMLLIVTPNAKSTGNIQIRVNNLAYAPVYRANGNPFKDFYVDSKVTLRYSTAKSGFIVQGEGGGGNAVAADILTGKTAATDAGDVTGNMPNRGAVSVALNSGQSYTVPNGYHNGNGLVSVNSLSSQTQGNATAAQILSGRTAWVNGSKITGTMPSKTAQTYTPTTTNQVIQSGRYLSGNQTIAGSPNLIPTNIKSGVSIFGVTGSAPIAKKEITGSFDFVDHPDKQFEVELPFNIGEETCAVVKIDGYNAVGCAYKNVTGGITRSRDELIDIGISLVTEKYDPITESNIKGNWLEIYNYETKNEHSLVYRVIE